MIAEAEPIQKRLVVRGGMKRIWSHRDNEVLVDGPAGTGKSYGVCGRLVVLCDANPGIRVLLARKTRASMSQSILVTWERVLGMMGKGPVYAGSGRQHRSAYRFANGSEVAVLGFDDPERIKSSEYDILYVNEVTELTLEDWEIATSRLRHNRMGWHQAIADCNPGAPNHWANRRADEGVMHRIVTRHADNPALHDGTDWTDYGRMYLSRLRALTGARRSRLLLGQWCAAEGAVFEEVWDVAKHCTESAPELRSFIAGVDWGYRHPGVIQVWGVDGDGDMHRVREVYRSGQTIDWWERQAKWLYRDYPGIQAFICDPSQPAHIEQFFSAGIPARGADRSNLKRQDAIMPHPLKGSLEVGLQIVEERLRDSRMFYVKGATGWYGESGEWLTQRDESLRERGWPTCTEDEFPLYAFPKGDDGKPLKEKPIALYDDGIDASRYVAMHLDGNDLSAPIIAPIRRRI